MRAAVQGGHARWGFAGMQKNTKPSTLATYSIQRKSTSKSRIFSSRLSCVHVSVVVAGIKGQGNAHGSVPAPEWSVLWCEFGPTSFAHEDSAMPAQGQEWCLRQCRLSEAWSGIVLETWSYLSHATGSWIPHQSSAGHSAVNTSVENPARVHRSRKDPAAENNVRQGLNLLCFYLCMSYLSLLVFLSPFDPSLILVLYIAFAAIMVSAILLPTIPLLWNARPL